jgi:hypothetical protein
MAAPVVSSLFVGDCLANFVEMAWMTACSVVSACRSHDGRFNFMCLSLEMLHSQEDLLWEIAGLHVQSVYTC